MTDPKKNLEGHVVEGKGSGQGTRVLVLSDASSLGGGRPHDRLEFNYLPRLSEPGLMRVSLERHGSTMFSIALTPDARSELRAYLEHCDEDDADLALPDSPN